MSSRRLLAALVGVALLATLGFLFWPQGPAPASGPLQASGPPIGTADARASAAAVPSASASVSIPTEERSELAKDLNSPAQDIHADLRVLDEIFNAFRTNFPQSGNPIGNNAEITAVLTGNNSRHIAFIPPDHPAINARGELCDRWGRPFFFHQLSGHQMEIRSAGPDKKFWTNDDVVLTP
jgi:hypothetical protein